MAFPEVERVIYAKNPLEVVICQVRFPPILKIETDVPSAFQERIRDKFPFYQSKSIGKLPGSVPQDVARFLAMDFPGFPSGIAHEFVSRDQLWRVSLTKDFISLSTQEYLRWEDFKEHLQAPLGALEELYRPTFFSRLGLRYQDVIRRSKLALEHVGWNALLQPWVAGILAKDEIAAQVSEIGGEFLTALPDNQGAVRVRHALALDDATEERCYLIDADFFNEAQTETSHAIKKLDFLNRQSRFLFRWCITDQLHQAMEPRPIEPA